MLSWVIPNSHLNLQTEFANTRKGIAMSSSYFGIDVAKSHVDLASSEGFLKRYSNDESGIKQLVTWMKKQSVQLVTIESTGIYSRLVADRLAMGDVPVLVAQPGRVRHYAKAQGQLAKTDAIDAVIIAEYGASQKKVHLHQPPTKIVEKLRKYVDRRDQMVDDRKRERARMEAAFDQWEEQSIDKHIAFLDAQIASIEKLIKEVVESDDGLSRLYKLIIDVVGVGNVSAIVLLSHLMELGHVNRQEIAALAGLAPYNKDSGNVEGKRSIYGGRERVRRALFMAAQQAARFNEHLKDIYQRLRKQGKAHKVAVIACARKLLIYLNTIIKADGHVEAPLASASGSAQ